MRLSKCADALQSVGITGKAGRTTEETATAICLTAQDHVSYDKALGVTPALIGKIFSTRWAGLSKSVEGGIAHFISADNGAYYAELWSSGENWYGVTGAKEDKQQGGIWEIPGITRGMDARDAVPLFLKAMKEEAFKGTRSRGGCSGC